MKYNGKNIEVVDSCQKQIKNHNDRIEFDKQVEKFKQQYNAVEL